jgi:hypothetical protein
MFIFSSGAYHGQQPLHQSSRWNGGIRESLQRNPFLEREEQTQSKISKLIPNLSKCTHGKD